MKLGVVASGKRSGGAFKSALGNVGVTAAGGTIVIPLTVGIAIGDLVVVRWACDNLSATTPVVSTCSDGSANSYTNHAFRGQNATAAAGVVGGMLATKATAAVASGGNITLTLSLATAVMKAAYAESFTGFDNTLRNAVVLNSATSTAATVTSGTPNAGDLVVGATAIESRAVPTYDTDTLAGSWSTGFVKPCQTSGTDASQVEITGQNKIVNAATAQTYNLTVANTDWAAMIAIFQATPVP